ncbi:hypothetical protein [Rhodococcus sp. 06-235-1A]|uniref:hypothetical protein n=1 Tax=Rhodococcus sp. 06-235-1A TaxID=2022508 RepID=UPI0015C5FB4B|nr:hypothetical protein [Rhodococcus sp. 06-235-1A]
MSEKRTKTPDEIHRDIAAAMQAFGDSARRFGEAWASGVRAVGESRKQPPA